MCAQCNYVLVVDDEPDLCATVQMVLELRGYDVIACADGAAALAYLRGCAVRPSLILLDLMMPRMSGLQFRQEQMRDPDLQEIPVYALTGGGDALLSSAAALGLKAIRKPIPLETLFSVVERFCACSGVRGEGAADHGP